MELCGLKDPPPVGAGSGQPLKVSTYAARDVHGVDGLGNANLPAPKSKIATEDGIGLMISEINSGSVDTVIATGPLTNVARAISRDSDIKKRLSEIFVMGGAVFVEGNITPYAEFNFYSDPDAADYVLNSGIPITLVSLDTTHKVNVTEKDIEPLKRYENRLGEFVVGAIRYSIDFHVRHRAAAGAHLHDPLAVAVAAVPEIGQYEMLSLAVDCADRRGMVRIKDGTKNVKFLKDADVDTFLKLFFKRIGGKIETS